MMRIYIPTLGRWDRQTTYNNLPPALQRKAALVVPAADVAKHDAALPLLVCPVKGIAKVRQWVVDTHDVRRYGPYMIMMDDDLTFYKRRMDDYKKFEPVDTTDMIKMMEFLESVMRLDYAHAGIRHREMAQDSEMVEENCRALRALAYDVRVLRKLNVRFDRLPVMEDFDVTLQLLRLGYKNAVISNYIQNQTGSNTAGGCSIYRTMEKQKQGALGLAKLHKDFVQVVTKQTKTAWNGQVRTDVRVGWKKAYSSSQKVAA